MSSAEVALLQDELRSMALLLKTLIIKVDKLEREVALHREDFRQVREELKVRALADRDDL